MGSDSDGGDYESFAALLAVAIAAFTKHATHTATTYSYLSRTRTASHRLRHLSFMYEIDESEGGDYPTKLHLRVRALRCSGRANSWAYIVERSPLLTIFHEGCVQKAI